jgi:hypothetical protein
MDVPIVIHCCDIGSQLHASEDCLTNLTDELPEGGLKEMEDWLKAFLNCSFGFTAILLNRDQRHKELTRVV